MPSFDQELEITVIPRALLLPGLILLLFACLNARAEIVRDLYSAQVPVDSRDSAALASASRDALAEVLVKVSGSAGVLDDPTIRAALSGARGHVQQYAYVREPEGELSARFEFDGSFVTRLVTEAGVPLWTANRPQVLVWMVVEQDSVRQFVNSDAHPELAQQLLRAFERRGVPVQLPLYDLTDSTAITTEEAWRLYAPALQGASSRYDLQHLLVGRAVLLSSGEWTGDWSYLFGPDRIDRSITAPQSQSFLQAGAAMVAEEMAARYAVAPTGNSADGVTMTVTGITGYSDYAAVVAWLESLELIDHANVEAISGDRIDLRLHAKADAAQLASIIELDERLLPLPSGIPGNTLVYQWQN